MKTTDTSESGLEALIVRRLVGEAAAPRPPLIEEAGVNYSVAEPRYVEGRPADYDRDHAVDLVQLLAFLETTQPEAFAALHLAAAGPARQKFLHRLQGGIAKRGVIDVLRRGVKHGPTAVDCFFGTPTPGNAQAARLFGQNIFSVTRQLQYSKDNTRLALDLCLFINGLPFATFELKNNLTKQTYDDAIRQYKKDRDPKELLFQFGRCAVHFAVDDQQVWMCTQLAGDQSWFLPFNQGFNDGAGNPPNPNGLMTAYLWDTLLQPASLTNILENYAQIVEKKDEKTGKKKREQIFPRYHQLDVVRRLLALAQTDGPGQRYLIQHSAGSGKSNSITWLAHQLVELKHPAPSDRPIAGAGHLSAGHRAEPPIFDTVIVITDRRVLDKQIRDNIKRFAQVSAVVGAVTQGAAQLRQFIEQGKKIIISTVQKFPFILEELNSAHRDRTFALLIDEAHSSQGGRITAKMHLALSPEMLDDEATTEDIINHLMETRKMLPNASYFAFTATPKNKTLEIFGQPYPAGAQIKHRPCHSYTMKQAIQEGFILDVLAHYTPVNSYYRLIKKIEDDPEFDVRRAQRKLRRYVEGHQTAIRAKAEIMVDHFHDQVIAKRKVGGQARAMIVTSGIQRAIAYYHAVEAYLRERKSRYRAIVAFSGEHKYQGQPVSEASLNGFPSAQISDKIQADPYRFLIVADKFQTGYDEPLLHTMYVDKHLAGVKAVQTLSRLNRAHPHKHDTFVLDFANDADLIRRAFEPYYRTTILSDETDANKLHDLQADLDGYQLYSETDIDSLVNLYLTGAARERLDPILDSCVAVYKTELDEDGQVDFKGKAKAFIRTYNFLASLLPYTNAAWEKRSIFLNFLVPKLPAPKEEDLSKGILQTIDMDSYRAEMQAQIAIRLPDEDREIEPVPAGGGGFIPEPELDRLSNIIKLFNDQWGGHFTDANKIEQVITQEIPAKVAADAAYQNARANADPNTARIELDKALLRVMVALMTDYTELFKQFSDDPDFKRWLTDVIFSLTYQTSGGGA
ncbi:MAG: type I restriction endonuclease subunit R [Anaerolineae bacterium]|nr:type I restriction endonuclease subunit R [Anaerolineae bacterium]